MSCNSPNKVFYIGYNPETGKKKIFYTSRHIDYIARANSDRPWQILTGDSSAVKALGYEVVEASDLVPCKQCLGCRMDYAREWACRMMLEAKNYPADQLWFVTCTYDDKHLPEAGDAYDLNTGELVPSPFNPVSKRDHQLFVKSVRKKFGKGVRFCVSGEYGDISYRPHLHYIFFGLPLKDLIHFGNNWRGDPYFVSPTLSKIWKKGIVKIGHVEFDTCEYVARYVLKKQKGKDAADFYKKLGIEPEFFLMSRRPGIGAEYFNENYESIYKNNEIILPTRKGAFTSKIPKYYETLAERVDPLRTAFRLADNREMLDEDRRTRKALFPFVDEEEVRKARERKLKTNVESIKGKL